MPPPRCGGREIASRLRLPVAAAVTLLAAVAAVHAAPTCALIGDSIAEDLRSFFPECHSNVKLGIGTKGIAALVPTHTDLIIVSAGSNDYLDPGLLSRLQAVRSRVAEARVIWIRPAPKRAADAVDTVARAHGDTVVPFVLSPRDRERLHPQSNKTLAGDIRRHFQLQRPGKYGLASAPSRVAGLSAPGKATMMRVHSRARMGHGPRATSGARTSHATQQREDSHHAYR
jgi:hypothetical protein